jgi:putative ABC transport system ATP-binding protein
LVLLAFYHPFLLGFDIVLVISMISITWILGRGGIRTAIDESITKYRVAHWLQDVLSSPTVFKTGGGEALAIARGNQLTAQYINARKRQFRVVIRQVAFAISLQAVASTALLALGGWLVIDGELTLGQLVASELVVTVVVGAFAKAGKTLEKFYDLMAGVDKVGHLIDIPADPRQVLDPLPDGPVQVRWGELRFDRAASQSRVASATIEAGSRAAIIGDDLDGCSDLARTIAGLYDPAQGHAQVGDFESTLAAIEGSSRLIGYAGDRDIFAGTLRENVDLGRTGLGRRRVREVLAQVGLADVVLRLSEGPETLLQTGGYPLSRSQVTQLVIARAMAAKPKLLIIDQLLDSLSEDVRETIWQAIAADDVPWTLVVVTNRQDVARRCDSQIAVRLS